MVRPRTVTPSVEDVIELGKDLVAWATDEETEDIRTSFCFWYSLKQGILRSDWKLLKQTQEFRPYYEIARGALAKRLHNDEIEKGMAHRYMRMYDRDLYDDEEDTADKEAARRANALKTEAAATETAKLAVLDAVQRNNKPVVS